MVRLFLKLYGLLIATLAFSFVVQMQLMDYVWHAMSSGFDFHSRFRPTFHLIERALAPLPPEEWPARFEEMAAGFGLPDARLVRSERFKERDRFKPEQGAAFEQGTLVTLEREGGGFHVFKKLAGSDYAAALAFPGPDNKRVRLLTYVVNWIVEFAIVAILLYFWVRPFWRDLTRLRSAAERVGGGIFETPVEVGRGSPLAPFAEAFRAMTGRISSLIQSHRTLTSAVSHELRTPLARLRFSQSLAREETDAAAKDRYLLRMERDIAEIDELTTELLDYAKLERGAPSIELQSVPAEPWLEDVLADANDRSGMEAAPAVIRASVDVESLRCEPRYMARAVINMVRNALQHARSTVAVCVRREDQRTVIHVDDDGCGVPQEERERLFEPFVRLDRSRGRDSGGFGIGLAIVRQVARWHGGDAIISDSPLGGARVTISW
jgi:two-component system, OmpR family, sensor kinase ParS